MAKKRKFGSKVDVHSKQTPHKQAKIQAKARVSVNGSPTIPFEAEDRILLIGEGDFSFARSIVEHHGCHDITATCLDTQSELFRKYSPQAQENVEYLESQGQTVLYNVDATKLASNKAIQKLISNSEAGSEAGAFDKIIFNFPHTGGKTKDVNRQVRFNQELLVAFFSSAIPLLTADAGTIIVTLFEGPPYTLWNIKDLARHCDLEVKQSFKFSAETYPGYSHSRTLGNIEGGGGWKGEERSARSYVFQRRKGVVSGQGGEGGERGRGRGKKRKKRDDESSGEDG